ncbi:hypothetical protein TGME49_213746 [Toxoplasma gondii ME49]|uniref:Transmembrane protein n=2 Tax=Toxoplasma gondii TaxID=5811 RepID=S8GHA1_TOXGM|nr:hypothetical protein TGME49_213746 [Toxoplasma gondii ME49]EPT31255.1 hypothetical protein TGME49_213746 [Toxoplasma gondii ME49]PIM00102.1 putative transmembrane protein [Toxoplasma gondii COUG]|eukprot:XP_002371112.2 hypothetical protein TGME49_213746 [Toxoplasma gondii ME49]
MEDYQGKTPEKFSVNGLVATCKWTSIVSGFFTLVLWVVHCFDLTSSLEYDSRDFFKDVNSRSWRKGVFSLDSDVFCDAWTPFIMGMMTILMHSHKFHMPFITRNWIRFGVWHTLVCLFGNMGYNGLAGMLVGSLTALTAALSFLTFCVHSGPAHLFEESTGGPQVTRFYAAWARRGQSVKSVSLHLTGKRTDKTLASGGDRFPPKPEAAQTPGEDLEEVPAKSGDA